MANEFRTVRKGESMSFSFDRGGAALAGWVCTIFVKKYPGDAADITRVVAADDTTNSWDSFLTPTETDALAVGAWKLIGKLTNADTSEEQQVADTIRFNVTAALA